ncbi:MAG: FtsX-like permease family protein [Candidatus Heimdallarchaeota archaeon]|nr:MAG: FtsX-like permease family protein [Candidatus Heimdallarchaeota archaeon]
MAKIAKNIFRALKAHKIRFFTISMVIAIGITSFNGMITAFVVMTRTYNDAFIDHKMASFTMLTANPGGSGEDAWIDYNNLTKYMNEFMNQEEESNVIAYELRIVYDTIFEIRGTRQNGRIVAYSTVDKNGNYREQPDVNGFKILTGEPFSETSQYRNVCLVETHLATYWKLEPHEFIAVGDNDIPFEILGTLGTPEYLINMGSYADIMPSPRRFGVVYLPLRIAQELLNVPGRVNEISVLLKPDLFTRQREGIAEDLMTFLEETHNLKLSEPIDRDKQPAYYLLKLDIEEAREFGYVLPAIILTMALGGLYVLLGRMVVAERKDIGVAQALGYSRKTIILQYLGIAMVVALFGTVLGSIFGLLFLDWFGPMYTQMLTIPFEPKVTIEWPILIVGFFLGFFTGLIGGYLPVRGAIQPLPAESLRFDPSLHITTGRVPLAERILNKFQIHLGVTGYKLPIRNFFRSKRRTFSSVFAVIVAVSLISMVFGMIESMTYSLFYQYEVSEDWDLRVDYSELPINASQIAMGINDSIDGVVNVTYHLISGATVTSNKSDLSKQVQLIGMNDSNGYTGHKFDFEDGGWDPNGIVMTVPIAEKLKVWTNDYVNLEIPRLTNLTSTAPLRAHFEMVNVSFPITGIVDEFNGLVVYMELNKLVDVSLFPGQPANTILVKIDNPTPTQLDSIRKEIYSKYSYNIRNIFTKEEQSSDFLELLDLIYFIIYIVAVFAVILSCSIIYNTIYINLQEQQREIATLLTIGTQNRKLIRNVTIENLIITIIGTVLGLILGWIMLWFFMRVILDMEFFRIKLFISNETMLISFGLTFIGVLVAQFFPLRRALNLDLAEATKERVI